MSKAKKLDETGRPCPLCGKPSSPDYRPFCSRRCADVDLARWLRGSYAIPEQDRDKERPRDDEACDDEA